MMKNLFFAYVTLLTVIHVSGHMLPFELHLPLKRKPSTKHLKVGTDCEELQCAANCVEIKVNDSYRRFECVTR
ncbi:hypothetical protein AB6A40_003561 [Gnathostoma spinigerum]|uniref:Uncharacterized protein n=1 Tax=Gnathostoma spinigerum TaxID=75299 RepID=A0ABD6EJV9_9BILA